MNIPHITPRPQLFRCTCGLVGKVRPGTRNVKCKGCGRVFGSADLPHNQAREMERRRQRIEKEGK